MAINISEEESIEAGRAICNPLVKLLDEAGADLKLTAKVVSKWIKSKNGRTALEAVRMRWQVEGLLIDKHETKTQIDLKGLSKEDLDKLIAAELSKPLKPVQE